MAHAPFSEQVAHAPFGEQVAHAPFGEQVLYTSFLPNPYTPQAFIKIDLLITLIQKTSQVELFRPFKPMDVSKTSILCEKPH